MKSKDIKGKVFSFCIATMLANSLSLLKFGENKRENNYLKTFKNLERNIVTHTKFLDLRAGNKREINYNCSDITLPSRSSQMSLMFCNIFEDNGIHFTFFF